MRDYGKVHTSFWASENIRRLSEDGRSLALYLLTCSHGTIAGVFRLPDGYACEDLQWEPERVKEGFVELFINGFANRCETTKWVWIVKHLEWNPPENPNQRKSAAKMASQIPDGCAWRQVFMRAHGEFLGLEEAVQKEKEETLTEPLPNQKQYQEQKQEETTGASADAEREPEYPKAFVTFWEAYPRKKAKGDALKAWKRIKPSERLAGEILQAVQRAKTSVDWLKDGGQFIPYPASWLNSRGWEDELGLPVSSPAAGPERPWHQTASGITAKGLELGVVQGANEAFPYFKQRVLKAAGIEVAA